MTSGDASKPAPTSRLLEIDALRGIAALSVVLFHYTTRFTELYGRQHAASMSFPDGHYGVNLFFVISGFVIFMTLEKTSRPMDFVVSRFSRLFPVYWAAIFITLSITHALGLPDKLVGFGAALANMLMIHGLFRVPHVDGVYWTLEVELLFYSGMLLMYRVGALPKIHRVLAILFLLRLVYWAAARFLGIDLPWTVFRLLILQFIPWFAIGISIYLAVSHGPDKRRSALFTSALAVLTLLIAESVLLATLATTVGALVWAAARGHLPWLKNPVLTWLGAISYPLYLVHENVGWSIQLQLARLGASPDVSLLLVLTFSLGLATLLNRLVEQPALKWIRRRYQDRGSANP